MPRDFVRPDIDHDPRSVVAIDHSAIGSWWHEFNNAIWRKPHQPSGDIVERNVSADRDMVDIGQRNDCTGIGAFLQAPLPAQVRQNVHHQQACYSRNAVARCLAALIMNEKSLPASMKRIPMPI